MKDLVVIATHNGKNLLKRCLDSISTQYPILVVDTGSSDPESIEFFGNLGVIYPKHDVFTTKTSFKGYDTGAYLWAYWNYNADNYLFLQDSLEVLEKDYIKPFRDIQPKLGCVPWATFEMCWDSIQQKEFIEYLYGSAEPDRGIFGPVFYVNRKSLDILNEKGLLPAYPINKNQSQGLERGWATAFHLAGMEVKGLYPFDPTKMIDGTLGIFKKVFAKRN
jgi:glycosyltransferase involved in cell wall biosynthesis